MNSMNFTNISQGASRVLVQVALMAGFASAGVLPTGSFAGTRRNYSSKRNQTYWVDEVMGAVPHNLLVNRKALCSTLWRSLPKIKLLFLYIIFFLTINLGRSQTVIDFNSEGWSQSQDLGPGLGRSDYVFNHYNSDLTPAMIRADIFGEGSGRARRDSSCAGYRIKYLNWRIAMKEIPALFDAIIKPQLLICTMFPGGAHTGICI